jgi:hypothetical protein
VGAGLCPSAHNRGHDRSRPYRTAHRRGGHATAAASSLFVVDGSTIRQVDGVLGVMEPTGTVAGFESRAVPLLTMAVQRISASKWGATVTGTGTGGEVALPPPERVVTTLIGSDAGSAGEVLFALSSAKSFRRSIEKPTALALHVPPLSATTAVAGAADRDPEADVGCLHVGCEGGAHAFRLAEGKRQHFPLSIGTCNGLAVAKDGAVCLW